MPRPALAGPKKPRSNEDSTGVGESSGTERVDAKQPPTTGIPQSRDTMRDGGVRVPIVRTNVRTTNDRIELCVLTVCRVRCCSVFPLGAVPTLPHRKYQYNFR